MKVTSKKDWWLTAIVWGSMLFVIGSGVFALFDPEAGMGSLLIVSLFSILLPVFILWMWLTTAYILNDKHLIVMFGPFKKEVPLESITYVKKTTNPLSSPALSMKRLEIGYGYYNTVLISPVDRDAFMKLLAERCPKARIG